ncbi:DedA family protein [Rhizobium sp. YIM 134829]|uniref:DedA family protein n=1 Tax=Rhizobium sp. YIM 134829 TaxID=3390453 RepID=UPI00397E128E
MDPLAELIDWIALYGVVGLLLVGLMERVVPAVPSHGVLVAVGIAASEEAWSVPVAIIGTAIGSFLGALALFLFARTLGERRSVRLLSALGRRVGVPPRRVRQSLASLKARGKALGVTAQLIPVLRLVSPLAAGMIGTRLLRFSTGMALGIVLWNGLFIAAGYLAVLALPSINASAFALKMLVLVVLIEALIALWLRLQRKGGPRRQEI